MMRPFTCLCLLTALGSGLYLYQEKHRAQLLDRDITRTVKQADATRDRIGLLRAEWALLNEHDRLNTLATQYLSLQPLTPTQFAQLTDLPSRMPAVVLTPAPAPVDDTPTPLVAASPARPALMAMAVLPGAKPAAALAPTAPALIKPVPVLVAAAMPAPPVKPVPVQVAAMLPPAPLPARLPSVQMAAAHPAPRHPASAKPDAEPSEPRLASAAPRLEPEAVRPALRPVYAPIVPAYQTGQPLVHPPTIQSASAATSTFASSAYVPSAPYAATPFVGSALGMAHSVLAAPVPVASNR